MRVGAEKGLKKAKQIKKTRAHVKNKEAEIEKNTLKP